MAAKRIKKLRTDRGWGTDRLDMVAGLGKGTTSRIESGSRGQAISLDVLCAYALVFRMGLDELIFGAERPTWM